jgi:mRNA-degrading endonuclease RelE of RelBE toxin-antitoxin system
MRIIITPKAQIHCKRFSKKEISKIQQRIKLLESDPYLGKKLGGKFAGAYSLRAWPYRILYIIKKEQRAIFVVSILHRQGVYNN